MLNVYDCFCPLRHTFGQFMDKCYNPDLAKADLDYVVNRANEETINFSYTANHKKYIEDISYEKRLESKIKLDFHWSTSEDLVVNLNNKFYRKKYRGKFKGMIYYIQF